MTLGQLLDLNPTQPYYLWNDKGCTEQDYIDAAKREKYSGCEVIQFEACKIAENLAGKIYESRFNGVSSIKVKLA